MCLFVCFFLIREKKKTYYGVECKIHTNFKAKTYDFENASGYSPDFSGGIVLKVVWKDGLVKRSISNGIWIIKAHLHFAKTMCMKRALQSLRLCVNVLVTYYY